MKLVSLEEIGKELDTTEATEHKKCKNYPSSHHIELIIINIFTLTLDFIHTYG